MKKLLFLVALASTSLATADQYSQAYGANPNNMPSNHGVVNPQNQIQSPQNYYQQNPQNNYERNNQYNQQQNNSSYESNPMYNQNPDSTYYSNPQLQQQGSPTNNRNMPGNYGNPSGRR